MGFYWILNDTKTPKISRTQQGLLNETKDLLTKKEVIKIGWFSDLEILELCIKSEKHEQDPRPTGVKTLNTEKKGPKPNWNTKSQKPKHQTSQHYKTNVNTRRQNRCRNNKKITTEKKTKEDWKYIQLETEKVNKLLPNIPTCNIIELKKLIYAEAKLICDEIGISSRNPERKRKTGWEIRRER